MIFPLFYFGAVQDQGKSYVLLYYLAGSSKKQLIASKNVAFVSCIIVMLMHFMWKQHKSPMASSALTAFLLLFQTLVDVVTVAPVVGSVASMLSCLSLGLGFESMHILHCLWMLITLSLTFLPSHFPGTYHTLFTSTIYFGLPTKLVL